MQPLSELVFIEEVTFLTILSLETLEIRHPVFDDSHNRKRQHVAKNTLEQIEGT